MADLPNGNYDWREQMRKNWEDHDRIWRNLETLTHDVTVMHATLTGLKDNTDKLVSAIRELIDRIPPENLR
ncbi:MAG TPA: hypothetical protein VHU83_15005 [Bryobacteraceae bacterium]|jgi:hypothetical protein|nr:hypothetical protein [Bryobacteraceae bacterium]